ncbi:MAG TPA: nitrilase-related carbon-nitrogen hydrolase, partial [Alphaproteobacteria bacterium]|nr:nitrilase-related carbon-nitrogen hydrolase [Alphaproteobacteria bacterium]
ANTPWGRIGLAICYDLRFPHLWRDMAKAGAQILTAPSAFTMPTGQAHWEVLLRARAIETGSFVLAAAQTGEHEGGRQTWGHSMIISPWGEILSAMEREIGIITAEIDLNEVEKARASIPALQHDRDYEIKI